jgi:quinol---cytochrome c reductase iron-sulfur subunit, bacillus type
MTVPDHINRRELFVKLGLLFDGVVAVLLGVPIVRFLVSPVVRGSHGRYESWVSLGALEQYPAGQTRMATYRNPVVTASDGETAKVACWVRRIDSNHVQVFAVRWFPQSGLFMCPCHGGAYYANGARASGPPERGLFEYPHKVARGELLIRAGEMPTPGSSAAIAGTRPPCA